MSDAFEVTVEQVPERTVLTERRRLRVDALPDFLRGAFEQQRAAIGAAAALAGAPFAVFHGPVTEDDDGPVEACTPVDGDVARVAGEHRTDPAHDEAFTAITRAQLEYPQVLRAYDAVAGWIAQRGGEVTGPPREVYLEDVDAAAPEDRIARIAFPCRVP
jgi:effector-binding domain-containing protein